MKVWNYMNVWLLLHFSQVSSTLCGNIPNKLEVFLVDDNGRDTQSSGLILWEDIDDINGIYQVEWPVLLNNNTFYQIFIISHGILGQTISEPFLLSMLIHCQFIIILLTSFWRYIQYTEFGLFIKWIWTLSDLYIYSTLNSKRMYRFDITVQYFISCNIGNTKSW